MLSIGIVGLPNVGKSTLFNALTKKGVPAENFPFCTIDPSVGVVAVPDERLAALTTFSKSAKTIPAAIECVDIAGLVAGAHKGEGLGNQFLSHIREVDAIAHIVRTFDSSNVIHVAGGVNPTNDIETIGLELVLADLQSVTKRLGTIEREVRSGNKEAKYLQEGLSKIEKELLAGGPASTVALSDEEEKVVKQMNLLTKKPMLYVFNGGTPSDTILDYCRKNNMQWVVLDAQIERDLSDVDVAERAGFRKEFGVSEDGVDAFIRAAYTLLGLITYFTTGETETRAWTIKKDSTAPVAGTAIHSDFHDKFIRAEVIGTDTLLNAGSYATAREQGSVRTEGKDYIVKDGDVIVFKI